MWMLEPSAKAHGIESTTRFRRKNDIKRRSRNFPANDGRARSGRKGGWASHKSAQLQRESQSAATWQSSQESEYENSSVSGYSDIEPPQMAVAGFATAGYYQPQLPPLPPQHFSPQLAEGYIYDRSSTYVGPEPMMQSTSYQNNLTQSTWSPPTSTLAHHPIGVYSTTQF